MFKMPTEIKEENKVLKKVSIKNDQGDFEKNEIEILEIKEGGNLTWGIGQYTADNQ